MTESTDRLLVDWLSEGPDRGPVESLERALAATRRTSQRPGWAIPERWIPMQLTMRPALSPRPYVIFLAALLLIVAAGALFVIGSQRRAAPPFGLAANGSIMIGVDSQLWLASFDGAEAKPLNIGLGEVMSPVFSPDGTKVAFMARPAERTPYALFVANADGSEARSVTGDMRVVTSELAGIAWSPDSSSLVFQSSDKGRNRLYRVGVDGTGLEAITDRDADRAYPSWSPDGKWLSYKLTVIDGGWSTHLAIARPDGTGEQRLVSETSSKAAFSGSVWMIDSEGIVYFRSSSSGHSVARVDLDGNETLLSRPDVENAYNPALSPDGRRVAFGLESGAAIVDLDDPSSRVDLPTGLAECGAVWSPDGTILLGFGFDCTELYRIPLDNPAAAERIAVPPGSLNNGSWQRLAP